LQKKIKTNGNHSDRATIRSGAFRVRPEFGIAEAVRFAFDLNSASRTGATIRSGAFRVRPEFGIANRRNNPKRCVSRWT